MKALLEGHLEADDFISDERGRREGDGERRDREADDEGDRRQGARRGVAEPDLHGRPGVRVSLQKSATQAIELGLLDEIDLDGIYDLELLNELLKADGREEVQGL